MKILRILLSASLLVPIALVAYSDKYVKNSQNDCRGYNGKNGKNGQNGANGQNGEDGGFFGGNGGNGGSGGNGGNGGDGGFFGGNGGNGGNGGSGGNSSVNTASGQVDELEYKVLKDVCRMVIAKIEEHFTRNGSLNFVAAQQVFKSELSKCLLSRGTPASQKIYAEYEAVGWEYPAIKEI